MPCLKPGGSKTIMRPATSSVRLSGTGFAINSSAVISVAAYGTVTLRLVVLKSVMQALYTLASHERHSKI